MFLFWRALPILRKVCCAQSMAPFRCHCSTFSCFCDRTWGWIKYNFLSLHFPGGHPKWHLCVPLVSFHEALLLKGQGHHYRHQKFVQWSRVLVLKQNFFHYDLLFPQLLWWEGLSSCLRAPVIINSTVFLFFPASKGCLPSAYPPPVGLLSNKKPVASRSIYVWVPFIVGEANSLNHAVLAFRSGPVTWS